MSKNIAHIIFDSKEEKLKFKNVLSEKFYFFSMKDFAKQLINGNAYIISKKDYDELKEYRGLK